MVSGPRTHPSVRSSAERPRRRTRRWVLLGLAAMVAAAGTAAAFAPPVSTGFSAAGSHADVTAHGSSSRAVASTPAADARVLHGGLAGHIGTDLATLTWDLTGPASYARVMVEYGPTAALGHRAEVALGAGVQAHTLGGLEAATQYHYRILGVGADGSIAAGPLQSFTTAGAAQAGQAAGAALGAVGTASGAAQGAAGTATALLP